MNVPANLEQFRRQTTDWIENNYPQQLRQTPGASGEDPRQLKIHEQSWLGLMAEQGYLAPSWPREYGGAGLSDEQVRVLNRELRKAQVRSPPISAGLSLLGPVLLEHGTPAQKAQHLPKIARNESRWCQGYSEPGSGSDLASLSTRAELVNDEFVVNGQKIWTSHADSADWMFCLVRTDREAAQHEGISFLLIDMTTPGISVAPIRLISGPSAFCQTFFDDVRVPKDNIMGQLGQGWTLAKQLLQHERQALGSIGRGDARRALTLPELAAQEIGVDAAGRISDPVLRDKVAQCELDSLALRLTMSRSADEARTGRGSAHIASTLKLYGSELTNRRHELMIALRGTDGIGWEGPGFTPAALQTTRQWLRAKGNSIEGGSNEIQRNVIAKRLLELPE
ncbi:MAG: acyl-CoA dehydrogenase family protein [Porticoccaceae bacterium]|nr:acyl-CoA dehydrogenase family protein [Porticoccaceae bacterium]